MLNTRVKLRATTTTIALLLAPEVVAAENFFYRPNPLCSALASEGLSTGGWKPDKATPGEWSCNSNLISFGSKGANGLQNNIAYYVNAKSFDRAYEVRIKINVNNPEEQNLAFSRLNSAAKTFFDAVAKQAPANLATAIKMQKPILVTTDFGSAELAFEPGRIDSFKLVLTDTRIIESRLLALKNSAGEFSRCKTLVAKAASYAESLLDGDGTPTLESGIKSFLFKGRAKDWFFCEVHADRRYKIRAMLDGTPPFKYIAEGTF